MKRQKGNEGEEYINTFPKFKKWIKNVYVVMKKAISQTCLKKSQL